MSAVETTSELVRLLVEQYEQRFALLERRMSRLEEGLQLPLLPEQSVCRNGTALQIKKIVASVFDLDLYEIDLPTRQQRTTLPRQVAMYVIREKTKLSLNEIAGCFANKFDHGTVLHACQKVKDLTETDPLIKGKVETVLLECLALRNSE